MARLVVAGGPRLEEVPAKAWMVPALPGRATEGRMVERGALHCCTHPGASMCA